MAKKSIMILFILLMASGCSPKNRFETPKDIQSDLLEMDSYVCIARVSYGHFDNSNIYEAKQVYKMDGRYRMEIIQPEHIKGLTTICNGDIIIQTNPKALKQEAKHLKNNEFRNQIFLGTFVKNYLQSEEVSIEVSSIDNAETTILEAIIPGGSDNMTSQKLWIDNETRKPKFLRIYNKEDKEVVLVEFIDFIYNPEINDEIFIIN